MRFANRGFSLVELLVVISIIVVLAALLLPSMGLVREQAKATICRNNQRAAGTALITYANDNGGLLPWGEGGPGSGPYSWVSAIGTLSDIENVALTCPSATVPGGNLHYTANLQTLVCRTFGNFRSTLKPVSLAELPAGAVMIFDAGQGQSGGVNAFLTSMNMGFTFYFKPQTNDSTPQPTGTNGNFMVQNRHSQKTKANYLFGDGHVGCLLPGDLTYGDFRVPANGRKYF